MFLTDQNVFHFPCMLEILCNTFFFKMLYFFVKMVQKTRYQKKEARKDNFFQNEDKHNVAF